MIILLIIPDTLKNPFGGMGIQAKNLINKSNNTFIIEECVADSYINTLDPVTNNVISQAVNIPSYDKIKDVDIIHCFDYSTAIKGRVIANILKKPLIMTVQLSLTALSSKFNFDKRICNIEINSMKNADSLIHVSLDNLDIFSFLNENSYYQPNGIDYDEWDKATKINIKLPGRKNSKKIAYIGRYAEMKNIEGIINSKIPEQVDFYFIGSERGGNSGMYDRMVEFSKNKDNVYFLGPKYGNEKINTLKEMDAVIVPSHFEPFGIVCLEALASNCILLSSFKDGMKDYLSEDIAINCGTSSDSINKAYDEFLSLTENEIKERNAKGIELCKLLSWERSAKMLDNIYQETADRFQKKL